METPTSLGVCEVKYSQEHELDSSEGNEAHVNNSKKMRPSNKMQWPVRSGIF